MNDSLIIIFASAMALAQPGAAKAEVRYDTPKAAALALDQTMRHENFAPKLGCREGESSFLFYKSELRQDEMIFEIRNRANFNEPRSFSARIILDLPGDLKNCTRAPE